MGRASVFENRKWVPLFAGSAALSWACAFPLIKLGLADFGIAGTDIGGKALFAGARFLLAGLVVLASIPLADAGEQPKEKSEFKRRTKRFANDVRRRVGGSSGRKA